jgi:hypothetical protein
MSSLTPEKALVFRITHIKNVAWILANGLHCRNSGVLDPDYEEIGNPDLTAMRAHRAVPMPPGGTLSDYIPFLLHSVFSNDVEHQDWLQRHQTNANARHCYFGLVVAKSP